MNPWVTDEYLHMSYLVVLRRWSIDCIVPGQDFILTLQSIENALTVHFVMLLFTEWLSSYSMRGYCCEIGLLPTFLTSSEARQTISLIPFGPTRR